ncbi:uncharacterized protein RHO25_002679 [Cercospora beticola]|uniref:Uncharacterized protein n=1 Tax=Cercospora beticola TaxID=122368 RepID=A0ABZ0NEX5_CERBT|nr:hypothetical protein RHO25_002679 [Cercospora beticola]
MRWYPNPFFDHFSDFPSLYRALAIKSGKCPRTWKGRVTNDDASQTYLNRLTPYHPSLSLFFAQYLRSVTHPAEALLQIRLHDASDDMFTALLRAERTASETGSRGADVDTQSLSRDELQQESNSARQAGPEGISVVYALVLMRSTWRTTSTYSRLSWGSTVQPFRGNDCVWGSLLAVGHQRVPAYFWLHFLRLSGRRGCTPGKSHLPFICQGPPETLLMPFELSKQIDQRPAQKRPQTRNNEGSGKYDAWRS